MSVSLMAAVFKCNLPTLKTDNDATVPDSTAKFVLLALADHANDEGEGSYPGVRLICRKTNLSASTVCNALSALRSNGFTTRYGKSKRGTYNYSISVARIREFQWLESADSSGRNPTVLATETNPSRTIIKPPSRVRPSTIEQAIFANVPVTDEMLKPEKYPNRSRVPEQYVAYADWYVEATGQELTGRVFKDWIATFSEWQAEGLSLDDLRAAYAHATRPDGGFTVVRPASLTATAAAKKGQRRARPQREASDPFASLKASKGLR